MHRHTVGLNVDIPRWFPDPISPYVRLFVEDIAEKKLVKVSIDDKDFWVMEGYIENLYQCLTTGIMEYETVSQFSVPEFTLAENMTVKKMKLYNLLGIKYEAVVKKDNIIWRAHNHRIRACINHIINLPIPRYQLPLMVKTFDKSSNFEPWMDKIFDILGVKYYTIKKIGGTSAWRTMEQYADECFNQISA